MPITPDERVLVTGGAGFIGSALVWALNQRGHDNIIISDFLGSDEKFKNLVPLRFDDYLEADDLLDALEELEDVRYVFHLGACSATTERDARYLIENNYEYTKVLAAWSLATGARFVYASSAATYGDGAQGMDDKEEDLHRLRPLNMYGYSKHLF
ncbi:MAG: NAD-dependent epimerase/dehydratase family protein, partial [Verrucomicrobiota bacterium]